MKPRLASRSIRHRLVRPPDRVRSDHRRTGSSRECTAPGIELPRTMRCWRRQGRSFPVPTERGLRTLAEALDELMSGQMMTAMDIIGQRFRAIEASILEEGGWSVARHLEVVPETGVDGGGGAPKPPSQTRPVEAAPRPALEAVERVCERRKES